MGSYLGTTSLGLPEEMLVNEKRHLWDKGSAVTATAIAQAPDRSRQHQVRAGRSALPAHRVFQDCRGFGNSSVGVSQCIKVPDACGGACNLVCDMYLKTSKS